jgi:DNA-binding CsgD family transcriptional regulator
VDGRQFTGFTAEAWRNRRWEEGGGRIASDGLLRLDGRTFFLALTPEFLDRKDDPLNSLTARELQIAYRISDGACDKVIAHKLGISEYTVREHVRRIFCKLHVSKRTAIVRMLWRSNQATQILLDNPDGPDRKGGDSRH